MLPRPRSRKDNSKTNPLANLGAEQRRQRIRRCHERYMLDSLFRTAQRLKPEDIRMRGSTKTLVHFALVVFLRPSLFRKGHCPANGLLPQRRKVDPRWATDQ